MKYCNRCKVRVKGKMTFCPLCQNKLIKEDDYEEDIYPALDEDIGKKHLILKVFGLISIIFSILALFFSWILERKLYWGLITIGVIGWIWIILCVAILKHRNIIKHMLYQTVIMSLFMLFIDFMTGWHYWSTSFVIPVMLILAMVMMYLFSKLLHLEVGDYMIYLLLDACFGIIPIVFLVTGKVTTDVPSLVCILGSFLSVIVLILFEGKKMLEELKRRFHV